MLDVSENKNACWGLPTKYQNGKLNTVVFLVGFAPKDKQEQLLKEFAGSIKDWMGNVNLVFLSFLRHNGVNTDQVPSDMAKKLRWAADNDRRTMRSALYDISQFTCKPISHIAEKVGIRLDESELT